MSLEKQQEGREQVDVQQNTYPHTIKQPKPTAPICGYYEFDLLDGVAGDPVKMAALQDGVRHYSEAAAATPGKISCQYSVDFEKKKMYWFESYDNMIGLYNI